MDSTKHWKYDDLTAGVDLLNTEQPSTDITHHRKACCTKICALIAWHQKLRLAYKRKGFLRSLVVGGNQRTPLCYLYPCVRVECRGNHLYSWVWGKGSVGGRSGLCGGPVWVGVGKSQMPAGNWVLTELLPHGPTPTGRVLHHRVLAATIAASPL